MLQNGGDKNFEESHSGKDEIICGDCNGKGKLVFPMRICEKCKGCKGREADGGDCTIWQNCYTCRGAGSFPGSHVKICKVCSGSGCVSKKKIYKRAINDNPNDLFVFISKIRRSGDSYGFMYDKYHLNVLNWKTGNIVPITHTMTSGNCQIAKLSHEKFLTSGSSSQGRIDNSLRFDHFGRNLKCWNVRTPENHIWKIQKNYKRTVQSYFKFDVLNENFVAVVMKGRKKSPIHVRFWYMRDEKKMVVGIDPSDKHETIIRTSKKFYPVFLKVVDGILYLLCSSSINKVWKSRIYKIDVQSKNTSKKYHEFLQFDHPEGQSFQRFHLSKFVVVEQKDGKKSLVFCCKEIGKDQNYLKFFLIPTGAQESVRNKKEIISYEIEKENHVPDYFSCSSAKIGCFVVSVFKRTGPRYSYYKDTYHQCEIHNVDENTTNVFKVKNAIINGSQFFCCGDKFIAPCVDIEEKNGYPKFKYYGLFDLENGSLIRKFEKLKYGITDGVFMGKFRYDYNVKQMCQLDENERNQHAKSYITDQDNGYPVVLIRDFTGEIFKIIFPKSFLFFLNN